MTHALYALTSTPDADLYRVTKFNLDYEVESSYLTGAVSCECPGFTSRGRCRHAAILSEFLRAARVDSGYFLEFETAPIGWHAPLESNELNAEKIEESIPELPPGEDHSTDLPLPEQALDGGMGWRRRSL